MPKRGQEPVSPQLAQEATPRGLRVLGIDPGTRVCGYACVEIKARTRAPARSGPRIRNARERSAGLGQSALVAAGALRLGSSSVELGRRLASLAEGLRSCIEEFEPDCLALEEAYFGKSVQSALRLGEARGVILLQAAERRLPVHQYAPATIKMRVAGHGGSDKSSVAKMVQVSLGVDVGALSRDASDAAAIALCHVLAVSFRLTERGIRP